jgi:prolyl 4-hydroxylase|tara:strand:+ start:1780 stop:2418 length:639 start_codon:yes stop_codon:yes gene_type:complete
MDFQYDKKGLMERIILPKKSLAPNFIGSWVMNPLSLCDDLIDYFESNENKQKRGITKGGKNQEIKNSTDITITPNEIKLPGNEVFDQYFKHLFDCYQDYVNQWPFLESFAENLQVSSFNLQRYKSGQHFQKVHTERSSLDTLHRVFAWMTYLNDVDENSGGSTFFSHYDLAIQPRKGLTLIWPAEWTHAHKGNVLKADSKYIITGWMNFPNN